MKHILVVTWQLNINKQPFLQQILRTISEERTTVEESHI